MSAIDSKYLYIINKATTNTLKQQVYHVQKPGMISQECWLLYIPCTFCIIWPGVIYTWYNRISIFHLVAGCNMVLGKDVEKSLNELLGTEREEVGKRPNESSMKQHCSTVLATQGKEVVHS